MLLIGFTISATNSGTVGSAVKGTNWWGALAAQSGAGGRIAANLLGLVGDEQSKRATYEGWAGRVTEARDIKGSISNYNELPSGLPAPLTEMLHKEFRLGHMTVRKNESFSPSISGEWTTKTLKARKRWACAKAARDLTACVSVIGGEIDTSMFQLYLKYRSISKNA